jgi:hypothetical protein
MGFLAQFESAITRQTNRFLSENFLNQIFKSCLELTVGYGTWRDGYQQLTHSW